MRGGGGGGGPRDTVGATSSSGWQRDACAVRKARASSSRLAESESAGSLAAAAAWLVRHSSNRAPTGELESDSATSGTAREGGTFSLCASSMRRLTFSPTTCAVKE